MDEEAEQRHSMEHMFALCIIARRKQIFKVIV